jgi:ribonucleoside-triphosphate reductase
MKGGGAADRLLSCLSNPIRLNIVRALIKEPAISFTDLMRRLGLDVKADTGRFGYHLRMLRDEGIVNLNSAKKYELTELGRRVADLILTLEDAAGSARSLIVRTSRLQMEPFNRSKIAEALEREAGVPRRLAVDIAREAEERILRLNVKYLTAPLIRELVNVILIERGLEDYRHSLTRLGLPVHDISELFKAASKSSCPSFLYRRASEAVLAEYVLLKVLPRRVADAHLSGDIHVCDLPGWPLRLSSIHHDLRAWIKAGWLQKDAKLSKILRLLFRLMSSFETHVGVDQGLAFFNVMISPFAAGLTYEELREELRFLLDELHWSYVSKRYLPPTSSLTLELSIPKHVASLDLPNGRTLGDYEAEARMVLESLLDVLREGPSMGGVFSSPQVIVSLRSLHPAEEVEELLLKAHRVSAAYGVPTFVNLTAGWQGVEACYSAFFSRLGSDWKGDWELDTLRVGCLGEVVINIPRLAYEAAGSDELFMEGLRDLVEVAVDAFKTKRDSLIEGLSQGLLPLFSFPLEDGQYLRLDSCSFNLTLVGLPEAVKFHVGEYPHESRSASAFAIKLLRALESQLASLSDETGLRLQPSLSPSEDPSSRLAQADAKKFGKSKLVFQGSKERPYYTSIHSSSRLMPIQLYERAKLEGMLHPIAHGGHVMLLGVGDVTGEALLELTRNLFEGYGVGSLIYDKALTYCSSCRQVLNGIKARCSSCGASGFSVIHLGRHSPVYKPSQLWSSEERDSIIHAYRYEL